MERLRKHGPTCDWVFTGSSPVLASWRRGNCALRSSAGSRRRRCGRRAASASCSRWAALRRWRTESDRGTRGVGSATRLRLCVCPWLVGSSAEGPRGQLRWRRSTDYERRDDFKKKKKQPIKKRSRLPPKHGLNPHAEFILATLYFIMDPLYWLLIIS